MKFLLFCIITTAFNYLSHQSTQDYRVTSKSGEKLPLYTGLYYALVNNKSQYIRADCGRKLISPPIDPRNTSHWEKIEKNSNHYRMRCKEGETNDYLIEKVNQDNYLIYCSLEHKNWLLADGKFLGYNESVVYCCPNCSDTADYVFWKFEEMPEKYYQLNAVMTDFEYETPLKDVIKEHSKKVDLLQQSTITNDSPGELKEKVSNQVKKAQSFQLSFSNSISTFLSKFFRFSVKASVGFKYLGIGANVDSGTEYGWDWSRNETNTKGFKKRVSNEVTYKIEKEITVPPFTNVQILSFANWIENLSIPYKSKITITGVTPRFEDDSKLDSETIKVLLSKNKFDERFLGETPNSLTFQTRGIFTGSFGVSSVFSAKFLGKTRENITNYGVTGNHSNSMIVFK